jgi:hypothetical protein
MKKFLRNFPDPRPLTRCAPEWIEEKNFEDPIARTGEEKYNIIVKESQ